MLRRASCWAVAVMLAVVLVGCDSGGGVVGDEITPPSTTGTATSEATVTTAPTTTAPATSAPETTTTTAATLAVDVSAFDSWERVVDGGGVFPQGSGVESIASYEGILVAVGPMSTPDAVAVWHSIDGVLWEPGSIDDLPLGTWIADVTGGSLGFVAVGAVGDESGRRDAAVWISDDGETWTRVAHDEAVFGSGSAGMEGVAFTADGLLVAVGQACPDVDNACPSHPAAWTSQDGVTWSRVVLDAVGGMNDVVAVDRSLIAVGTVDNGTDADAMIWVSADGSNWMPIGQATVDEIVFGGDGNQWMSQVASNGDVLVVAGSTYDFVSKSARPLLWSSAACPLAAALDIREGNYCWTGFRPTDAAAYAEAVAANGTGFLAVGYASGDPESGLIWVSNDGDTWQTVPVEGVAEGAQLLDVTFHGPRAVIAGLSYAGSPIWISPPATE